MFFTNVEKEVRINYKLLLIYIIDAVIYFIKIDDKRFCFGFYRNKLSK